MFDTNDKKQVFANWLLKVANADNNVAPEEMQVINNIGRSLGMDNVEYRETVETELDDVEAVFLLRELYRLAVSDKDFAQAEKDVIQNFIRLYKINASIVSVTEKWANNYLANEKEYFAAMDALLGE